ncbi:MAG TPA: radical SAM protein [Nitrospiria bacterium]|nr:radical SAM protein [Nitrospiria bacterium]
MLTHSPQEDSAKTPRTQVLETYFRNYPDTPREVILKIDLLRLGHWFTDAALEVTQGALIKSYRLFSYDFVPMEDLKRKESRKVPEHFVVLGGQYALRPVMVQTSLSPDSPYVIDVVDGRLVLTANGQVISDVRYERAPQYYKKAFPDGTLYHEVIAFGFFVTVFRNCQYWGPDEECKFCDINWNARQMSRSKDFTLTAPVKRLDFVSEVADEIGREVLEQDGYAVPLSFLITGGTIKETLHGKTEDEFYGEYVEALKWGGPRRFVNLQTNAKPKEILKRYRSIGLDSHHANLEVWDKRLFEWIAPGKAQRVGWDTWVKWLLDSVDVFGEGAVKPIFVCGIEMAQPHGFKTVKEAVDSTTEGIEYLMSHGVIPRFNQWRREPKSYIVKNHEQPPIPLDFYILLMRNRYEIWKKYHLPLPNQSQLLPAARYLGVSHGTHEDYIHLMENTYPPDIVEIVDRWSTPYESFS